mmetsp:Transcript_3210/g.10620  ORF Transcript_3210/g.10620 Transcript_3210/m.10620 type:complete len:237 (+) Transcript_3210:1065-1775(+)
MKGTLPSSHVPSFAYSHESSQTSPSGSFTTAATAGAESPSNSTGPAPVSTDCTLRATPSSAAAPLGGRRSSGTHDAPSFSSRAMKSSRHSAMVKGGGSWAGDRTMDVESTAKPEPRMISRVEWCEYRRSPGCSSTVGVGRTWATATPSSSAKTVKSSLAAHRRLRILRAPTGHRAFFLSSRTICSGLTDLTVKVDFWSISGAKLNSRSAGVTTFWDEPSQNLSPSMVSCFFAALDS